MPASVLLDTQRRVYSGSRYLPRPVVKILESRMPGPELSPRVGENDLDFWRLKSRSVYSQEKEIFGDFIRSA